VTAEVSTQVQRFDTEVQRVVDRLRGMPINRLPNAAEAVRACCTELLAISARIGDRAPVPLPHLQPGALGDQVAVLAADLRAAARQRADRHALDAGTNALSGLRRAL